MIDRSSLAMDDRWVDDPHLSLDSPPTLWEVLDSSAESVVREWGGAR